MSLQMLVLALTAAAFAALALGAALTIVRALRAGGRRDESIDSDDARSTSRFTIPVSIVVPVGQGVDTLSSVAEQLLALNYPEIEVLLVCDEASGTLITSMAEEWQMEARELFYRRTLPTAEVRRIYRSARDPRLILIDKRAGGHADAMNCGINVARYRFVAAIERDVVFDSDALLRLMASPLQDPGRVVAASSLIERGEGAGLRVAARELMNRRLASRRRRTGLDACDAVTVWRRDAVLKSGGFPIDAIDPALALAAAMKSGGDSHRIERSSTIFGRAPARPLSERMSRRVRRRLGLVQLLGTGLRQGRVDRATWRFTRAEVLAPLAVVWILAASAGAALAGWTPWSTLVLSAIVLSFGRAAVTAVALLLRGAAPNAPGGPRLKRLLLGAPVESLLPP